MKYKQTCIHIFTKIGTNMHTMTIFKHNNFFINVSQCRNLIDIVMSFLLKIDIRKCIHLLIYHLFLLLANLSNCTFTLFRGIQLKTENAFM